MKKDNDTIIYGKAIRDLRIKNDLTQEQLAQKTGFDPKYISQLETGRYMGTIKTMLKFCEAFNVTPNDILFEFIKNLESKDEVSNLCISLYKLNKRDRKNVLALIESMISN